MRNFFLLLNLIIAYHIIKVHHPFGKKGTNNVSLIHNCVNTNFRDE